MRTREETLFQNCSSAGAIPPPPPPKKKKKSHRSAFKLSSKKVKNSRFFSYLPIENLLKRPGASPRRKSVDRYVPATNRPADCPFLAPARLDGFSIGRFEKNRESFYFYASQFESGAIRFFLGGGGGELLLGVELPRRWNPFKTRFPPLSFCKTTVNGELKFIQNRSKTTLEAKRTTIHHR